MDVRSIGLKTVYKQGKRRKLIFQFQASVTREMVVLLIEIELEGRTNLGKDVTFRLGVAGT